MDGVKYHRELGTPDGELSGLCRRHAPALVACQIESASDPVSAENAVWPVTNPDDWCGDWKPAGREESRPSEFERISVGEYRPKFPTCVVNSVRREGIEVVGDLLKRTADELLVFGNLGDVSLRKVRACLAAHGLYLRGERSPEVVD